MTDESLFNRRRVLELSGVGTSLAVAGCMNQLDGSEAEDGSYQVGIALQIDQQRLQSEQLQIQQEVQSGNLSEEDAQTQIQELQQQLVDESFETVESEFESTDITIDDRMDRGLMLITGSATDILDALGLDSVQAVVDSSTFEDAQAAQEQQQQQAPAPEDGTEDTENSTADDS